MDVVDHLYKKAKAKSPVEPGLVAETVIKAQPSVCSRDTVSLWKEMI